MGDATMIATAMPGEAVASAQELIADDKTMETA
jgi:hypothetical protein